MKEKRNTIIYGIFAALLIVSAVVIYLTHEKVPFMLDDFWYSTKLFNDEPVTSFRDIVESQVWHYFNWGGRSMAHGLLQLILLTGERTADILNVIVTFLLAGLICRTAGVPGVGREDIKKAVWKSFPYLFAALGMLFGLNASWEMSMFWQSGAANYLYITVFVLGFLACFLRELEEEGSILPWKVSGAVSEKKEKSLPGITLWIIPLGILAGWSNENMGPAVWLLSLFIIFLRIREKRKIKLWMILGNLTCLFGSVMMVAAPGNFLRNAEIKSSEYGLLWRIFLRSYEVSRAAVDYLFPTVLLTGVVILLCKLVLKIPVGRRNLVLLLGAVLSWGAMILSPHYPDRATFGTMVLLICVILNLTKKILNRRPDLTPAAWGFAFFIWLRGMYFLGEFLSICWGWIK